MVTSLAPGMLRSGLPKPSRTCTFASLPSWRMRRCRARPLPSASPSGLRCEVMRKLRPPRIRSATARAPSSGFVGFGVGFVIVIRSRWILGQDRLDAAGAHGRLVVAEVELRRVAQTDALAEEMPHLPLRLGELLHQRLRLFLVETAQEDAREVQVGADVDTSDGEEVEARVLEIVAEHLHERFAHALADTGRSAGLSHPGAKDSRFACSRAQRRLES